MISSPEYEHVTSNGVRTINTREFLCFEFSCEVINREYEVFNTDNINISRSVSENPLYDKKYIGCIQFKNCRFRQVNSQYFTFFNSLQKFNISDVELESLQPASFQGATILTNLIASHNQLTEIPARLFAAASKLTQADLSNNLIERVDSSAFEAVNQLLVLDLSHNNITKLNWKSQG